MGNIIVGMTGEELAIKKQQWKQKRENIAKFYNDNAEFTMTDVAHHFNVSMPTVRKALRRAGIEVDHARGSVTRSRTYRAMTCCDCGRVVRCYHPGLAVDNQVVDLVKEAAEDDRAIARAALAEMSKPPQPR